MKGVGQADMASVGDEASADSRDDSRLPRQALFRRVGQADKASADRWGAQASKASADQGGGSG